MELNLHNAILVSNYIEIHQATTYCHVNIVYKLYTEDKNEYDITVGCKELPTQSSKLEITINKSDQYLYTTTIDNESPLYRFIEKIICKKYILDSDGKCFDLTRIGAKYYYYEEVQEKPNLIRYRVHQVHNVAAPAASGATDLYEVAIFLDIFYDYSIEETSEWVLLVDSKNKVIDYKWISGKVCKNVDDNGIVKFLKSDKRGYLYFSIKDICEKDENFRNQIFNIVNAYISAKEHNFINTY